MICEELSHILFQCLSLTQVPIFFMLIHFQKDSASVVFYIKISAVTSPLLFADELHHSDLSESLGMLRNWIKCTALSKFQTPALFAVA